MPARRPPTSSPRQRRSDKSARPRGAAPSEWAARGRRPPPRPSWRARRPCGRGGLSPRASAPRRGADRERSLRPPFADVRVLLEEVIQPLLCPRERPRVLIHADHQAILDIGEQWGHFISEPRLPSHHPPTPPPPPPHHPPSPH